MLWALLSAAAAPPSPPVLPEWAVGAWRRDYAVVGHSRVGQAIEVLYVQSPSLFYDCRIPVSRPVSLRNATSLDDYDEAQLRLLTVASCGAGGTIHAGDGGSPSARWGGNLTWHCVLAAYTDVCLDPAVEWPRWENGTHESLDVGAIEIVSDSPSARLLHEHAYPIDYPVVQYEQLACHAQNGANALEQRASSAVWGARASVGLPHGAQRRALGHRHRLGAALAHSQPPVRPPF